MRNVKIGRLSVEIYDSIDELPIKRFHKYNKMVMVDSCIGSEIEDVNMHISKIDRYIAMGDSEKARAQLANMRQAIHFVTNEINIGHLSFMVLIKSINGKEVTDLSDENLMGIQKRLESQSKSYFSRLIESVKKKNRPRARSIFSRKI